MARIVATITEILGAVEPESITGLRPVSIQSVACHPVDADRPDCLFFCINEYLEYNEWQTWRHHLESLPQSGVVAVVTPEKIDGLAIPQMITRNPRRALGRVARLLAGCPDRDIPIFGVTGTNGKTTTTRLLAHLLNRLGKPCGTIGTLGTELSGAFSDPGVYTTPLAPQLYDYLSRMRTAGAGAVAMEVSSHGLALDRVEGLVFEGAILTNVERDHLDFHGTEEAYADAKRQLFGRVRPSGICVINRQARLWESFAEAASSRVITYGHAGSGADLQLVEQELLPSLSRFSTAFGDQVWQFETRLVGAFQVENTLATIALLAGLGYPGGLIADALRDFPPVCGRMEQFTLPNGATAIVDYAHNPDGLKHVLKTSRHLCAGDLHVVFGCGGDRDKGKRPLMGSLAEHYADVVWVTSDNPRTEDPDRIIADIMAGCASTGMRLHSIPDRKQAIADACAAAGPDDVVVIAGKGHEDYQLVGHTKHPFSDQAVLLELGAS